VGVWREEDHPRGYHGHFISKVAAIGSAVVDATKAAGGEIANRIKQVGKAITGATTMVPAAIGVYYSTLFARLYRRPLNSGAQSRSDYGSLPSKLANFPNKPDWLEDFSVETWNHALDGHAPESTEPDTDKFIDGSTDGIVNAIINAIPSTEPRLRNGSPQLFVSRYNGQTIRIFLEYVYETGKWDVSSVHPYSRDIVTDQLNARR